LKHYGKRLADRAPGSLGQQPGETLRAYEKRFSNMTREEKEQVINRDRDAYLPEINSVLKQLRSGAVPWRWFAMGCATPPVPLDAIMTRYQKACKEADARWHAEVAQTPIDDAAWERELRWRREITDSHPDWFTTTC
jgi:hypothetical protein